MAANTHKNDPRPFDRGELDGWLWAFEAGLLEPGDEARLIWHLAGDPVARARLDEIRNCFDAVAARSGASLVEARARARSSAPNLESLLATATHDLLRNFAECGEELKAGMAAIAVLAQGSLFARAQQSGWTAAPIRSHMLSPESEATAGRDTRISGQEVMAPDGTKVTLVKVGEQKVDILVALADKTKTGIAELRQVTSKNGRLERTIIAIANIENGTAEFRQCEAGLLEVQLPNSSAILIGFASVAQPAANS